MAKKQKEHLSELIGRLNEDYVINLTTLERFRENTVPLAISLQDRQVEVPLSDWGSGTQNRTEVLMSLMEAARTKAAASSESRTTPVVILEEPESFLHPHAQAEFGKLLGALAEELGIQVIATTHSPYMLNHVNPESNILLRRKQSRKRLLATEIVETTGDNWMAPFAEILGIIPEEFSTWKNIISAASTKVLLVEGETDVEYFDLLRLQYPTIFPCNKDVEIESYGGKDALRNTAMLRFVRRRFEKMFITFDLDAEKDVRRQIESLGMKVKEDFLPLGVNSPGAECIEGLVPTGLKQLVYSENVDLVEKLQSADAKDRKSAKNSIKRKLIEKMKTHPPTIDELAEFDKICRVIVKALK